MIHPHIGSVFYELIRSDPQLGNPSKAEISQRKHSCVEVSQKRLHSRPEKSLINGLFETAELLIDNISVLNKYELKKKLKHLLEYSLVNAPMGSCCHQHEAQCLSKYETYSYWDH
jgi:hypothetical protein